MLPYASACGYRFHALAIYLHPTFTIPPIGGGGTFVELVKVLRLLAVFAEELHPECLTGF